MSESKAYFDSLGAGWDALQQSFFSERVRERALELAAVEPGRIAADLGAGTGFMTQGLVERGVRVVAVDQSSVTQRYICLTSRFRTLTPLCVLRHASR